VQPRLQHSAARADPHERRRYARSAGAATAGLGGGGAALIVLETAPGQVAQVDFGDVGKLYDLAVGAGKRFILTLVDMSLLDNVLSGDREAAFRETKHLPLRGTAILGANIGMRIVLGLGFKALKLLGKGEHPLRFFDDEAEARRWLAERRAVLLAARRLGPCDCVTYLGGVPPEIVG